MSQALTRTPYTIGFCYVGTISADQLPIKVLRVNGVLPTADNIRTGRYPLLQNLAFVFLPQKLSAEAKAFLDFVRSSEGGQIMQANGYVPEE
jgi:phosphate transport system substrate-binding protein